MVATTACLPRTLLEQLDDIAARETDARKKEGKRRAPISRNDVIERLLKDAVANYYAAEEKGKQR